MFFSLSQNVKHFWLMWKEILRKGQAALKIEQLNQAHQASVPRVIFFFYRMAFNFCCRNSKLKEQKIRLSFFGKEV